MNEEETSSEVDALYEALRTNKETAAALEILHKNELFVTFLDFLQEQINSRRAWYEAAAPMDQNTLIKNEFLRGELAALLLCDNMIGLAAKENMAKEKALLRDLNPESEV